MTGLLTHPDQLDAVRNDRALLPQAIEEGLRWEPPLLTIMRTSSDATSVCGVDLPAGAMLVVNMGAANHDENRWEDADAFNIFRPQTAHIAFASGPHMCLGMHLARMETKVAINRIFDRLPNLRLDPDADLPYITGHDVPLSSAPRGRLRLEHSAGTQGGHMDQAAMMERVLGQADKIVQSIDPSELGNSTPCTEWSVRDVINHVVGGATMFAECVEHGSVPDERLGQLMGGDNLGDDYKGAFSAICTRAIATFGKPGAMDQTVKLPFGEMPAGVAPQHRRDGRHDAHVRHRQGDRENHRRHRAARDRVGVRQAVDRARLPRAGHVRSRADGAPTAPPPKTNSPSPAARSNLGFSPSEEHKSVYL